MKKEPFGYQVGAKSRTLDVAAIFLGFVSGFPLLLTSATLQAWCVADGLKLTAIGALSLLGWPYMLKFLWAPMLEKQLVPWCRQSKVAWVVCLCLCIAIGLYVMSCLGPKHFQGLIITAAVVAWCAATLDAAIDGYRIELLPAEKYGLIAGGGMVMYRLAMMVTGGLLIVFADHHGWQAAFNGAACCMVALAILCALLPKRGRHQHNGAQAGRVTLRQIWKTAMRLPLSKPQQVHLLLLVLLFKSSDAFIVNMGVAFLLRHCHLSLEHLGILYKVSGVMATLLGAVVAGWCLQRRMLKTIMTHTLGLQCLAMCGFLCLAIVVNPQVIWVDLTVIFECFVSGMASTTVVTMLMRCCACDQATTRYAFLSAIPAGFRILVGPSIGSVAQYFGWTSFFALAVFFAILPWCMLYRRTSATALEVLQNPQHAGT